MQLADNHWLLVATKLETFLFIRGTLAGPGWAAFSHSGIVDGWAG